MKRSYTIIGLVLFIAISVIGKSQCLVLNVPLDQRVAQSDVIIEGKVISINAYWNEKRDNIYTSNSIEVYKIFKGNITTSTIEIVTEGGLVDDTWIKVEPSLNLTVGETGVFLCDKNIENTPRSQVSFKANTRSLGFIKYDLNESSASDLFTKYGDIQSHLYTALSEKTGNAIRDLGKFNVGTYKNVQTNRSTQAAPVITSFSPTTVSAGSKTLLTINGSGFGVTRGTNAVGFYNSNDGGSTWVDVNDNTTTADDLFYVSWSDTKIEVYVPARNGTAGSYFAGTGKVCVNVGGVRGASAGNLYVKWARYEAQSVDGPVPALLANINGTGGYTWQMGTSFAANTSAAAAFARAITTWSCETGVNWNVGANTTTASNADDGINVIRYSNSGELGNGILAATATTYRLFCGTGATRRWYLLGFDMAVNTTPLSGYTWQNGPANPSSSQYDLETVMVHELGHAMQLGHIIKPGFIMNYSISNGEKTRTVHTELSEGGNAITLSSFATATCVGPSPDGGAMIKFTPASCVATGITIDQNKMNMEVYPNPVGNILTINTTEQILSISIFDQLGKEVYKEINKNVISSHSINTEYFPAGIYFVRVIANENMYNQKVVIYH